MEFVLNTTISTPGSSRSGSVMHFGDYREDEEHAFPKFVLDETLAEYLSDSDDEDAKLLEGFNEMSARHRLTSSEHCIKIDLDRQLQQELGLEIGVNVSHEHPWKQIRRSDLIYHLSEALPTSEQIKELHEKLSEVEEFDYVLVGYAQPITKVDEANTFLVYAEPKLLEDSIIDIIRNLELFERVRTEKTIHKRAKPWRSLGSEKEVNFNVDIRKTENIEIEVQRISAPNRHHAPLQLRLTDDIRDGYVELLPKAADFDCVQRKRVSIGIQAATQRIHSEQQTDPTFPTNAWTQYYYEMPTDPRNDVEVQLLEEEENPEKGKKSSFEGMVSSENIESLIKALEFNTIDIYRDDYSLIASESIAQNHTGEMIKETACYIDFDKSRKKFVVALAWHPSIFGVFAISYSHNCLNILSKDLKMQPEEIFMKSVLQSNYTLLWSFSDSLYPKLVLSSPREIVSLSFCPCDGNLLIGGMSNGQFVVWSLQTNLKDLNTSKMLKQHEQLKRSQLYSFMEWSKSFKLAQLNIVHPIAITSVDHSHKKLISVLHWLNEEQCGNGKGLIQQHVKAGSNFKLLLTASIDGSISLWDVDGIDLNREKASHPIKGKNIQRRSSGSLAKGCSLLRPIHTIFCEQPISSLIFAGMKMSETPEKERFILTTCIGTISDYSWDDFRELKSDTIKAIDTFGAIHNGFILRCISNPNHGDAVLSIGWHIFAIWSSNTLSEPIYWRRRKSIITCAEWSTKRATMFFIAMHDGVVEVWDLSIRRDIPIISYDSGLTLITVIRQNETNHSILFADGKANTRTLMLQNYLDSKNDSAENELKEFMIFGLDRIEKFAAWREKHKETTSEYLEPKETKREDSRKFLNSTGTDDSSLKKSKRKKGSKHMRESATEYSDDLRRRYEQRSVKRLISTLLNLKQLNLGTIEMHIKPEKDRQLYNLEKKRAIEKSFRQIHEEISEVRARLTVPEEIDEHAQRMDFIGKNVNDICGLAESSYDVIEAESNQKILDMENDTIRLDWHDFLEKAKQRRSNMNRVLYDQKRHISRMGASRDGDNRTLMFDCSDFKRDKLE